MAERPAARRVRRNCPDRVRRPEPVETDDLSFGELLRAGLLLIAMGFAAWLAFRGGPWPEATATLQAWKKKFADSWSRVEWRPPTAHAATADRSDSTRRLPVASIQPPAPQEPPVAPPAPVSAPPAVEPAPRAAAVTPLSVRVPPHAYSSGSRHNTLDPHAPPPLPASPPAFEIAPAVDQRQAQIELRERQLQQWGAVYYRLDGGGPGVPQYRFYCQIAVDAAGQLTRHFEATAEDPLHAVDEVLREVSDWKRRRAARE